MTNLEIAQLFRKMAAAYLILNENRFKIIAYERAADSIEHLTREVKDVWDDGKLDTIPGVGEAITKHLNDLFTTGKIPHFDEIMKKVPQAIFPLLSVPGIGPKKAYTLVSEFKLKNPDTVIGDLEKCALSHRIAVLEGFGEKSEADILEAIETYKKGQIKEDRMVLPVADSIAGELMAYLGNLESVKKIDILGSLRRRVATIGDIDIAVATNKPEEVINLFVGYPNQKIIEKGPTGASILLHNGRQADLRVQVPEKYGAMLQYFTGSKNHNIKLRSFGLAQGKSLNEYGIKLLRKISNIQYPISNYDKKEKLYVFHNEKSFYNALGLAWIPPELREDKGEIEASLKGKLPKLVELSDIKGDLHIHTNYDLQPSHDLGVDPLDVYLDRALQLGYAYIGISDHNPKVSDLSDEKIVDIMKRRKEFYEHKYSLWVKSFGNAQDIQVRIFIMCEVDIKPDGSLALPDRAFDFVDAVIVSIHSSFNQPRKEMTKRVTDALRYHPKVRIFGHPTGRLLTKREGIELDWDEIFAVCAARDIALEINAEPMRLDLPDTVVYDAVKAGLKLSINTDSHGVAGMDMMRYGVDVAKRGWCSPRDIVNALGYTDIHKWLVK